MEIREQNKELRRQRILLEARRIVAQQGYDALTTRNLAKAAGVTQPTLYNLIGSKEDIFRALTAESVQRVWDKLNRFKSASPLETVEAVAIESIDLFAEDEAYYRAATIASDRIVGSLTAHSNSDEPRFFVGKESVRMATEAAQQAIDAGHLQGRIPARTLGEQMYICYRGPLRDWAYGFISLKTFRERALRGFYMVLAIDATSGFRAVLEQKSVGPCGPHSSSVANVQ